MVVGYPAGRYPGVGHLGVAYHWSQVPSGRGGGHTGRWGGVGTQGGGVIRG